jgi:hypothetical protein
LIIASFIAFQALIACFEYLNFLDIPFSSTKVNQTLVGFPVKGQISITFEASTGFSNCII